ncbi:hypothetical protein HZB90_00395 [archaeon]|nr:hypothetical protein [archaeon]
MSFSSSRKAQVDLSLQSLVGIIIAIVVILISVALFISLMNIFISPPDSGTAATFNRVYDSVAALYDPHNTNTSCKIVGEYLGEDWSLVGFNADGVIAADNNFACKVNEDCIEESCGHDDNVQKPSSCGTGPCLCVCDGGGDVDGDDCKESGAVCKKFPRDSGFDRFYFPLGTSENECGIEDTLPNGKLYELCDLVIRSESCWQQKNYGVKYTLVIMKRRRSGSLKDQIVMDITSDARVTYPEITVTCTQLLNDLKNIRGAAPTPVTPQAQQPQGSDVVQQGMQHGSIGYGGGVRVNQ